MAAHAVAMSAPDRLPAKPGLMYRPPVQSVMLVYWCFLRKPRAQHGGAVVCSRAVVQLSAHSAGQQAT